MSDQLIDQLVSDLAPRKPLVNIKLWIHCTGCLVIVAGTILTIMGLRTDYLTALQNGSMLWKPGLFLAAWIGSLLLITDISRPMGKITKWHFAPLILAASILLWQLITQFEYFTVAQMVGSLKDTNAIYCLSVILGGGGMVMFIAWKVWFARTASPKPTLIGALAGINAGSLAATAYALHCNRDFAIYILAYYCLPVLALSIFGGFLGQKRLSW